MGEIRRGLILYHSKTHIQNSNNLMTFIKTWMVSLIQSKGWYVFLLIFFKAFRMECQLAKLECMKSVICGFFPLLLWRAHVNSLPWLFRSIGDDAVGCRGILHPYILQNWFCLKCVKIIWYIALHPLGGPCDTPSRGFVPSFFETVPRGLNNAFVTCFH